MLDALRRGRPRATIEFLSLDLADLSSVKRAADKYLASGRPLDVLVNNAGVAGARGLTRDGFEITLGTNHLGPYLFTELLLPRLREAAQGRVVNVSSRAHLKVARIDWEAFTRETKRTSERLAMYALSKLLNVLHAKELARRLAGTRITTYALHPGVIASDVWREVPAPARAVMKLFMKSNEDGAKTSLYCATSPDLADVSGQYFDERARGEGEPARRRRPPRRRALDPERRARRPRPREGPLTRSRPKRGARPGPRFRPRAAWARRG